MKKLVFGLLYVSFAVVEVLVVYLALTAVCPYFAKKHCAVMNVPCNACGKCCTDKCCPTCPCPGTCPAAKNGCDKADKVPGCKDTKCCDKCGCEDKCGCTEKKHCGDGCKCNSHKACPKKGCCDGADKKCPTDKK